MARFLEKLQSILPPGVRADLPTEAEWEHACRAETDTAFSFGDSVTHEQVNINLLDDFGQPAGKKGRRQTVPVASLPPNAWGLYEMHGNVLEWCADFGRKYVAGDDAHPAQDPVGDQRRSARNRDLGFRLALRS